MYSIFKLKSDKYASPYYLPSQDLLIIKNRLKDFDSESGRRDFLSVFPNEMKNIASRAISPHEATRPDWTEIKTNAWFQDNLVKGIFYLENFYSLPENNKTVFLMSLAKMVDNYSEEIIEKRVVPFITTNMIQPALMYHLTLLTLVLTEKKLIKSHDKRK
jgi:hypothetical protein